MAELKEIIKYEYAKCLKDPVYFIKRYCYIQHPKRGKIKFELYPFQERLVHQLQAHDKTIILKSRQLGISTVSAAYALWMALFYNDKNIIILATKQSVAKNIITKVREMYDKLPVWLRKDTDEYNRLSVRFRNGSQIKAESTSKDSGRSEAVSLLIVDEAAFIDHIEEIWASAQQTLATGGQAIVLSTPYGVGNFFHDTWVRAEEGRNGFNPIRLHWTVHPERDQEWRDKQDKELGKKMASQECDCNFLTSGASVVDFNILEDMLKTTVQEPMEKRGMDGSYWIWKAVDYSRNYMVVADVARGDGSDYSTFQVIDVESVEQVAEYRGKLGTKDFGNFLVSVAVEWNDAMLIIENTGVGWAAIQPAVDRDYPNLYYTNRDVETVTPEKFFQKGYDVKHRTDMVPGFTTSTRTRPLLVSKMELYCRERAVIIRSKRLIEELKVFIWHPSGRPSAQNRYNDDLVMAFAIAMFIRDTALKLRQQGIELTKNTIDNIGTSVYSNTDASIGMAHNPWEMELNKNEKMDLTWLI